MNLYASAALGALLSTAGVGVLALFKGRVSSLQRRFEGTFFVVSLWSLALLGQQLTQDPIRRELWDILHYTVLAFSAPVFLLSFRATKNTAHISKAEFGAAALLGTALAALNIFTETRLSIVSRYTAGPEGVLAGLPGPLWPFYAAGIALLMIITLHDVSLSARTAHRKAAVQIRYLVMAAFFLGIAQAAALVQLFVPSAVMVSITGLFLFDLTVGGAMVRARFLDFELLVKQGMIFSGIVLSLAAAYSVIVFVGQVWMERTFHLQSWAMPILAAVLVALGYRPIENTIRNITDHYFFKKRYSYQDTLREAGQMMAHLTDSDRLLDLIARIVASRMRLKGTAVLFFDSRRNRYRIAATGGSHTDLEGLELSARLPLLQWIQKQPGAILIRDDLEETLSNENISEMEIEEREAVLQDMERLRAMACVPSARRGLLLGVLVLGEKKSGDPYTEEDFALLQTLSAQGVVAVENSILYGRTIKKSTQLQSLLEAGQQVTAGVHLQPKLDAVTRLVVQSLDFVTASTIRLIRASDHVLEIRSSYGFESLGTDLPSQDAEISQEAFREKRPVTAPIANSPVKVMMAIPLSAEGQILGTLQIYSSEVMEFEKDEITLVLSFASAAAAALRVTQMYHDLKATQDRLIQSEKLATIGTMASGIAHEIKNPLTALKTFAELLPKKFDDPHFRESFTDVVSPEIDRIDKIVADLLSFAKPSGTRTQTFSLHDVIDRALRLMNIEFKRRLITVAREYGECDVIQGDPQRLMQVFMNLLLNASHAIPKSGGEIRIHTEINTTHVTATVSDTGKGIPAADLPHIFTPFFTTKEGGTGLGLAISLKIIEDHEGEIVVASRVGEGTTFTIRLPLPEEDPRTP